MAHLLTRVMNKYGGHGAGAQLPVFSRALGLMVMSTLTSIILLSACGSTVKYSTIAHTAVNFSQNATVVTTISAAKTTAAGTVTPVISAINPIDTGTADRFTVPWAPPAGTSLAYLTFYNSLKYTNNWLWVRQESADVVRVGFTEYAQLAVGNFWFVGFSKAGTVSKLGDTFGFIQGEDSKDVHLQAPVAGTILAVNQAVLNDYRLINVSPYDEGWLVTFKMSNPDDLKLLLSAAEYALHCCPPCHCVN